MISTIAGTISTSVSPGNGSYASALTISKTGAIDNQNAISAHAFGVNLINLGSINGEVTLYLNSALKNSGIIQAVTAVSFSFSDTATNTGQLIGTHVGINLDAASTLINSGLITGGYAGVLAPNGSDYVFNSGTILQSEASGFEHFGVDVRAGRLVNTGTVTGFYGVLGYESTISNSNVIHGLDVGIVATGTDLITNSGNINGSFTGIELGGGTVNNSGTIHDILNGINATYNADIINTGSVYGGYTAIALVSGGEVTNAGTLISGNFAVLNSDKATSLALTINPGAFFTGLVEDEGLHGHIMLGGTTASILNMGTSFVGFSQISFASGSKWTLEGSAAELAGGETITGFGLKDSILLEGFAAKTETFVSGKGLILSNGLATETLNIVGVPTNLIWHSSVSSGNTMLDLMPAPCFCRGTRIATASGNVPVEQLRIGDLVKTAQGALQPIRWIGTRSYDGRFIAGNHLALPVRIRRHALGWNVPSRDLYLSPDHSLCEGGVLTHAWRFINGVSITQAQAVDRVEYFHIELDRHEVIFANNMPVESFLDTGCRDRFHNAQSAAALPLPMTACLPRVEDGYYLARLQQRIDARAGIVPVQQSAGRLRGNIDEVGPRLSGWAQDEAAAETPVELELMCGGRRVMRLLANRFRTDLRAAGLGSGCHAFELALPPLPGAFSLRRVRDGAVLGGGEVMPDIRAAA